ncbi:MAG: hypothetical protein KF832_27075 [Caldilineaceae bacterium]|nr:hypothetical protein [Caldilineaceae bacterium]
MNSAMGKAGFHIGFFIIFVSGGLFFIVERGSPEFAITLLTFTIGVIFLAIIITLVKWGQRH